MNIKYLVKDGSGDQYVPIYPFHQETYEQAGGGPGSGSLVNKKLRIAVTVNIADESQTYTLLNYGYFLLFSEIEVQGERHTFPITGQAPFTWQFDKPGEYTFYVTLRPSLPDNVGSPTLYSISNIITSISLPYGIETLPASIFATMNMPNVDIIVPSSVKRLNRGQFAGCSLHKLVIPKNCIVNSYGIGGCAPEILEFHGTFIDAKTVPFGLFNSYLGISPVRLKKLIIDCRNTQITQCQGMPVCEEIEVSGNVETILGGCFGGCSQVKKITLSGNKLKQIQVGAFSGCSSLVDISIADSVEDIQPDAFDGCTSLKYIKLPSNLKVLKAGVFTNSGAPLETVILPEGLEEIQDSAFTGIGTLKNVNIPSTITTIPSSCFVATGLQNIDIPNNIITIGGSAFASSQLVEINIPDSVTTIQDNAFSNCKLQKIYVPNSVVNVGATIFYGNHNTLEEVYIDSDAIAAKSTGSYQAVYRSLFPLTFGSFNYVNIKKVELGPHVTTIGAYAFYQQYPNNTSKQKVEIIFGESVKEIQQGAFQQAVPANELDLSHVETIGQGAFYNSFDRDIQKTIRLSSIKSIPNNSTFYNLSVENLIIDSPCTTLNIADNAFYGTFVYNTLRVDSNVTFGGSTFSWLDRILSDTHGYVKNIIFGDLVHNSLQNISTSIFSACTACEYVHFGRNIQAVPKYMFNSNTKLATVEHCLIRVCEHTFDGCTALQSFDTSTIKIYDRASFKNSSLGGVIQIPSDGSVGYFAFYNTNITRFICEGTIISGAYPLTNCKDLEYIEIDHGLIECVNYNFSQLVSLKEVITNDTSLAYLIYFPELETVKMINPEVTFYTSDGHVFNNSPKLKDIYIYNRTAPELGGQTFMGCAENVKVHVPANAIGYEAWVDGSTQWYYPYQLHWEIVKDLPAVEQTSSVQEGDDEVVP